MNITLHRALGLVLLFAAGCGDDGGGESTSADSITSAGTSADGTSSDGSTTTGDGSSGSSTDTTTTGTSTTDASSSGAGSTGGGSVDDGTYPSPAGGTCPNGTASINVPAGELCGPFCEDRDDVCPGAESGAATAECIPFEQNGGSGTACMDDGECGGSEACGTGGTCVSVAFWACRLSCANGETCPDAMQCSGNLCGYPS